MAGPPDGRLDPQQREQLRHDLRRQGVEAGGRSREERYRGADAPGGDWPSSGRGGRSPDSRGGSPPGYGGAQPRDDGPPRGYRAPPQGGAADWGGGYRGRGPEAGDSRGEPRERMTPEERRQLRMLLRERYRSTRE